MKNCRVVVWLRSPQNIPLYGFIQISVKDVIILFVTESRSWFPFTYYLFTTKLNTVISEGKTCL